MTIFVNKSESDIILGTQGGQITFKPGQWLPETRVLDKYSIFADLTRLEGDEAIAYADEHKTRRARNMKFYEAAK